MPSHLDVQSMRVAWDAGRLGLPSDRNFEVEARAPEGPQGPGALRPGPSSPPWDRTVTWAVPLSTLARLVSARARARGPPATLGVVLCSGTMRPEGPRPGAALDRPPIPSSDQADQCRADRSPAGLRGWRCLDSNPELRTWSLIEDPRASVARYLELDPKYW